MTATAVALISMSVVLHASWNRVAKGQPSAAFFFIGNLIGALLLLPSLVYFGADLFHLPRQLWGLLAATGIAQAIYCATLAAAYRTGDLSFVYPLVRSLGPVFVVASSFVLGRGDAVGPACVAGIATILCGACLLGLSTLRASSHVSLVGAAVGYSVLSAAATAGYTLIDDGGVRILREFVSGHATSDAASAALQAGIFYAALQGLAVSLALGFWVAINPVRRADIGSLLNRSGLWNATLMGVGSYSAYVLVLISMSHVSDVSYVAGFRQLSIPLGAAIGVIWLREPLDGIKASGLGAILVGLLLIALDP